MRVKVLEVIEPDGNTLVFTVECIDPEYSELVGEAFDFFAIDGDISTPYTMLGEKADFANGPDVGDELDVDPNELDPGINAGE